MSKFLLLKVTVLKVTDQEAIIIYKITTFKLETVNLEKLVVHIILSPTNLNHNNRRAKLKP